MQKKMGEDDPALIEEVGKTEAGVRTEIRSVARGTERLLERVGSKRWTAATEAEQRQVRDKMVDLLNRRSYIRNLVRDVNEALESWKLMDFRIDELRFKILQFDNPSIRNS